MKNPLKTNQKTSCKRECFFLPLEAFGRPRMASNTCNLVPRRPQDGLLVSQTASKTTPSSCQNDSQCLQDGPNCGKQLKIPSRSPLDLDFGPSRPRFCILQASFLDPPNINVSFHLRHFALLWCPRPMLPPLALTMCNAYRPQGATFH